MTQCSPNPHCLINKCHCDLNSVLVFATRWFPEPIQYQAYVILRVAAATREIAGSTWNHLVAGLTSPVLVLPTFASYSRIS